MPVVGAHRCKHPHLQQDVLRRRAAVWQAKLLVSSPFLHEGVRLVLPHARLDVHRGVLGGRGASSNDYSSDKRDDDDAHSHCGQHHGHVSTVDVGSTASRLTEGGNIRALAAGATWVR